MAPPPEPPATPQATEFHDLVNNARMHDAELELDDGSVYYAHRVFLAKRSECVVCVLACLMMMMMMRRRRRMLIDGDEVLT